MKFSLFLALMIAAVPTLTPAQNEIRITGRGSGVSVIDYTRFDASPGAGRTFLDTLRRNLDLTGQFREGPPSGAEFRVTGQARESGGQLNVTLEVIDGTNRRRFGKRYQADPDQARMLGRQVADEILMDLKNQRGFATSRIAMIGSRAGSSAKELFVMFPDGEDVLQVTRFNSIVLGPRWAPDGQSILYTTYHRGFQDLVRQHLQDGRLQTVSSFSGMNTGGALSPDGRTVAMILSRDGRPELYARDLRTGRLNRLTNTPSSGKSSPSWSPDGNHIVFVSGHEGRPHLYVISRSGGAPRRLTTGGAENLSPHWGANGLIVFTRRMGRNYQTAVIHPDTGDMRLISPEADAANFEEPSWAPNGRHVAVTRTEGGQSSIYLLDTGGSAPIALLRGRGNWRMPAWSP
jgi:TolB protein